MKDHPLAAFVNSARREVQPQGTPEAQRDDMLSRVSVLRSPSPVLFARHDFVVFREGLGPFKKRFQGETQFMFWEYIETNDPFTAAKLGQTGTLSNYPEIDCTIAFLMDGGLVFDFCWSPMLTHGRIEDIAKP